MFHWIIGNYINQYQSVNINLSICSPNRLKQKSGGRLLQGPCVGAENEFLDSHQYLLTRPQSAWVEESGLSVLHATKSSNRKSLTQISIVWVVGCNVVLRFESFSFDAADLQPVNTHLLTVGVHTCICHSQHKTKPRLKGLSLCSGPAFGILGLLSLGRTLHPPVNLPGLGWSKPSNAVTHLCVVKTHACTHTGTATQVQRQVIFTAASGDISAKVLHMNGHAAVCPPVMSIWVYIKWSSLTSGSPSTRCYPVTARILK